ncbi:MAG: ABC transporter ATP-binding protein [Chryseolinea sp.]
MKIYLRILEYTPRAATQFFKFLIFAIFAAVFNAGYLGLIKPLIDLLFTKKCECADQVANHVASLPAFSFSGSYFAAWFNFQFAHALQTRGPSFALLLVCAAIVILVLISNTFRYLERLVASRVRVDVVRNIRTAMFENVTRLHIGFFSDQRKGDLISRFTNDVSEVESTVISVFKAIKEPITITVFIIVLFTISVKLTLICLLVLPVIGGLIGAIVKQLKKKAVQSQETMGRIVNTLDEAFSGMRVINAFNARNFILGKIEDETSYHRKINFSISRRNELASPVSEFLGVFVMAGVLFYGGISVMSSSSELTPSDFLTFLTVFASMMQPAKTFSQGITGLQKGIVSAERIFSVIDTESAIRNKPNAVKLETFSKSIEFKDVSFSYEKELVLRNINLKIEKGKTIALVGASGGGKSTLADLIPRFYDPQSGAVLLDDTPITDYDIESLRKVMGVVTQESILFNDSIFNNIAFGMKNVREEDVIQAAKVANAHDFISQTENGYQTFIGERGSKLSGGQRQRLSIARAVLKNPPILILDEATSALDSESEKLVQDALTNLMKNRTSVVIAHRLSTIQHADEIVVIQQGEIVERGTHDSLIRLDGVYKKLIQIQKL